MTVGVKPRTVAYVGDGVTVAFAVPFQFFELAVFVAGLQLPSTAYTTAQTAVGGTGSVVCVNPPAPGSEVRIVGATIRIQAVDYVDNGQFPAETHEQALDRLTMIAQEQDAKVTRSVHASDAHNALAPVDVDAASGKLLVGSTTTGVAPLLPDRSGVLGVSATGTPFVAETWEAVSGVTVTLQPAVGDDATSQVFMPSGGTSGAAPTTPPDPDRATKTYVDAADAAINTHLTSVESNIAPAIAAAVLVEHDRAVLVESRLEDRVTAVEASTVTKTYVDTADNALDGRVDALEAAAAKVNYAYWGTTKDEPGNLIHMPDVDQFFQAGFNNYAAEVGITLNAPPATLGAVFAITLIKDEYTDSYVQIAWPMARNLGAGIWMRGQLPNAPWTAWTLFSGGALVTKLYVDTADAAIQAQVTSNTTAITALQALKPLDGLNWSS